MAQKKKKNIISTAKIEKRNILNEIRNNSMSLQELRFFSIYLSKINARDISTRVVKFPIGDFQRIMGLQSMNFAQIRDNFTHILQQIVSVPNENEKGFTSFQLFKRCKLYQEEETGEWYVEIDAHDDALPLMFEFKRNYFTYELWNALRLKSSNQIRMYEILKQYEKIGERELTVQELKAMLGISPDEYPRWDNFKRKILDSCQQALKETTDICYTYQKGRSGRGGTWLSIIFHIYKNTEYVDQLTLSEFIDLQASGNDEDNNNIDTSQITFFDDENNSIISLEAKVPDRNECSAVERITAEVDERIDYKGMILLEQAAGGTYSDEKIELLETIRNIIIQVIAGYMPVRINKHIVPQEYAKTVFSQIDCSVVSNVICKYLEYPSNVIMPKVLLAALLFNEVNNKGVENAGIVTLDKELNEILSEGE